MTDRPRGNDQIRRCASRYVEQFGIPDAGPAAVTGMTDQKGMLVADLYEMMAHHPDDLLVRASYRQFIQEVVAQYTFIKDELDLQVEAWNGNGEPYRSSGEMMADVRSAGHLYYLPTSTAWGGPDGYHVDHPMLTTTTVTVDGDAIPGNDVFRVVHDVFAHAKEGHQFGPSGEEGAWWEHLRMFSPLARPALTSETRGQTCWTFFGSHLRRASGALIQKGEAGWTPLPERPFPVQKAGLLPEAVSGVRLVRDPHTRTVRAEPLPGWRADSCLSLAVPDDVRAALHSAYYSTTYRAYGPGGPIDIRIGAACPLLDGLLARSAADMWAFLTAWNPGSSLVSSQENRDRQHQLEHRLRHLGATLISGAGIGDCGTWPPEESVLALNLAPGTAAQVGAEFGQNAIVVGRRGTHAELVWCRAS